MDGCDEGTGKHSPYTAFEKWEMPDTETKYIHNTQNHCIVKSFEIFSEINCFPLSSLNQ